MSARARLLATVIAVTVPLALSGCVGQTQDAAPSQDAATAGSTPATEPGSAGASATVGPFAGASRTAPVTLTWWTGQSDEAEKILEGLAADFTKAHPNVTVHVSAGASTTDALLQKLSAGFAADTYPDVSYVFGSWASELAGSGKVLDVSAAVAEPEARWAEFSAGSRATATPDGHTTIGFPAVVGDLGLLYNKTVFDAAGVAYPTASWTWDDFRAAAKKLTNPAKSIYGTAYSVVGSEDTTWHMWPQLWQNGGDVLAADGKSAAFNSDAGVRAVTFWRDLAQTDKSVYLDQTDEKYGPLFVSNNIGMIISGPWMIYDLTKAKARYGVAPLPSQPGGPHQTVGATDLWALFDHKDANRAYWSYELSKWLTQPEQDAKWNIAQGNLPLRAAEKDTQAFKDAAATQPGLDVFVDNLANVTKPRPTVKGYVSLSKIFGKAVGRILQGQGDPKVELDKAATAATAAIADS